MKIRILFLSMVLFISAGLHGQSKGKINVLIIDGYNNHDWRYTTEVIYSLLIATDLFNIDISTAPVIEDPDFTKWDPRFKDYDVVVQNCNDMGNGNYWPDHVQRDFEEYMNEGGGLYVYHSANNAFRNWEEYNRMIGLGWRNPEEGVAIEIVDGKNNQDYSRERERYVSWSKAGYNCGKIYRPFHQ